MRQEKSGYSYLEEMVRDDLSFLEAYSTTVFYPDFELIIFMISQCFKLKPLMVDITSRMLVPALSMGLLLADYII